MLLKELVDALSRMVDVFQTNVIYHAPDASAASEDAMRTNCTVTL